MACPFSPYTYTITDVKHWYMQSGLQLNPDKSEVLLMGMTNRYCKYTE